MAAIDKLRKLLDERGIEWSSPELRPNQTRLPNVKIEPWGEGTLKVTMFNLTPEQAIAATLGWIEEPDTIRNELADGGLIADVLAPVCVDEKERRAFERGRVHERFAQQIFKEATS